MKLSSYTKLLEWNLTNDEIIKVISSLKDVRLEVVLENGRKKVRMSHLRGERQPHFVGVGLLCEYFTDEQMLINCFPYILDNTPVTLDQIAKELNK